MSKVELMSPDREIALIREVNREAGDFNRYKRALDELVLSNVGLVHKICHKFPIKNANCSYDDLYQEGIAGLIHGIHKFDVTRGYRLSTYVYRWIAAYVSRYFQNQGKTIRIPVHLANEEMKIRKQVEQMTHDLGRTPTQQEIEADCGNAGEVIAAANCVSLNQMMSDSDELEAVCGVDHSEENDYVMQCELMIDKLRELVSPRDLKMFIHRYGLLNESPRTLSEISEEHGVSRARVHQITNQVMNQMRVIAY